MKKNSRKHFNLLTLLVAVAALEFGISDARAQYGGGMGWGFMGMGGVPSPTQSINQLSLVAAGRPSGPPPSRNVYANNPNSYLNRVRDNGFTPHYSVSSRRPPGVSTANLPPPNSSQANNAAPPVQPEVPRPVIPIGSFFNEARKLIWPNDSPVAGGLLEKRDTSDKACLTVAELVEKFRSAPITTVTEARQKLLDYGRPALSDIRSHSTPRIADAFHLFMLSLYDSLAQAAESPVEGTGTAPAPQ